MLPLLAIALVAIPPKSCCSPSMSAFAADPAFVAAHLTPLPFKFQDREGRMLDFPDSAGGNTQGYYVAPHRRRPDGGGDGSRVVGAQRLHQA